MMVAGTRRAAQRAARDRHVHPRWISADQSGNYLHLCGSVLVERQDLERSSSCDCDYCDKSGIERARFDPIPFPECIRIAKIKYLKAEASGPDRAMILRTGVSVFNFVLLLLSSATDRDTRRDGWRLAGMAI